MHVSINIPFNSAEQLSKILSTLQKDLKLGVEVNTTPEQVQQVMEAPAPAPAVKKSGNSKKKSETAVEPQQAPGAPMKAVPESTVQSAPQTETVAATKEMAHTALTVLNNKLGLPKAREVLGKFKNLKTGGGCQRLGEINPNDYAAFIKLCDQEIQKAN